MGPLRGGAAHPLADPPPLGALPQPAPPPGWTVEVAAGSPALGSTILCWCPDEGWQLGRVRRRSHKAPFAHVVGYQLATAAFAGEVDSLLDEASYGARLGALGPVRT